MGKGAPPCALNYLAQEAGKTETGVKIVHSEGAHTKLPQGKPGARWSEGELQQSRDRDPKRHSLRKGDAIINVNAISGERETD